jgi:hypothetical protein
MLELTLKFTDQTKKKKLANREISISLKSYINNLIRTTIQST